jgi:hypothetical protein
MFLHIMVGVSDFNRAMAFFTPVLQALDVQFRFLEEDRPYTQAPHHPGNWQMAAFLAVSRQQV